MTLASALLAGEAELLQAAAAATSLAASHAGDGSHQRQQQQWLAQASAGAADGAARSLLWDGDAAALVSAVLGAVAACKATNQWAKVEQLLDAAADALAAAAAVHGVRVQRQEEQQQWKQQAGDRERRTSSSSGNSSYDSAGSTDGDGEAADNIRQQQEQEEHALLQHALQEGQSQLPSSSPSKGRETGGDGWGDGWSSEGEGEDDGRLDHTAGRSHLQQQVQQQAAAIAATEPLRAAVLQCLLSAEAVWQLQAQIQLLRGQVRAARLLTKHGCCVSVEQVATADAAAAKDWLGKLLGRAERYADVPAVCSVGQPVCFAVCCSQPAIAFGSSKATPRSGDRLMHLQWPESLVQHSIELQALRTNIACGQHPATTLSHTYC
jgi:hypothetical protein